MTKIFIFTHFAHFLYLFVFCYIESFCLYNKEISLAVVFRQLAMNCDIKKNYVIWYFFHIAHPYFNVIYIETCMSCF